MDRGPRALGAGVLRQDLGDDASLDVGQPEVAAAVPISKPRVVTVERRVSADDEQTGRAP